MFAVGGWDEAVPAFTFKVSPLVVRDFESAPRPAARALSRFARHELDSALRRTRPRRRRVARLSREIASARRARPERQEAARTGARVKPRFTLLRWRGYARTKSGTRAPAPRRGRARRVRAEIILKVVDRHAGANLELEERRPALLVDPEVQRKIVAQAGQAREPLRHRQNVRDGPSRARIGRSAEIGHLGNERGLARGAKAAARPRNVASARERFVVLHGHEGAAGLAGGVLDQPVDAELIDESAAGIDETDADVVARNKRLNQRAIAVALPKARGAIRSPRRMSRSGCRRKSRSSRPACSA